MRARGSPRRRPVAAVVGAAVALLAAWTSASPAGAQSPPTTAPDPAGPRIVLVAQDPWTPIGGDVAFRLALADVPPGGSVGFTAYQEVTSREGYDETMLRDGPLGPVRGHVSVPLDAIPADQRGHRTVAVGLQDPAGARDPSRLDIRRPGVYPMAVDLRDAEGRTVASLRTALVVGEADRPTIAQPLGVAWVWPLHAPPGFRPDGGPDPEVAALFRPEGRLGRQALALRAARDVPITLAPTGDTMMAWVEAARTDPAVDDTLDAVRAAASTHAALAGPYVPVDVPSLLDHGLASALDEQTVRGAEALDAVFGTPLDRRTRVLRPASPTAVAHLRGSGIDRVIVDAAALAPLASELRFTLAQPVVLRPDGSEATTALVTDPGFQEVLTSDLPPGQRAQVLIGALAVVALETPSVPRVVVLVNPEDADAPPEFTTTLLTALQDHPFLRPMTVTEAFDTVPVDPPAPTVTESAATAERSLVATPTVAPPVSAPVYLNQRARLNSFGAITHPGDPAVGTADRALLASVTDWWPPDHGRLRAEANLRVVDHVIDAFVARLEVPDPRTITLTSRSGEIPLTFRNDTGHPVRVRASLASEKLFFPEGSVLELELPPRSTTVRIAVEARTSGTFPLDLEVTSTDGVLSISQRRLEVRSTFVSTVGVVLMVSAAGFLALWWGIDLRRRHRRRRHPTT